MTKTLITRDDARAAGRKRFYTGVPCKYGHVDERLVSNGGCATCLRISKQKMPEQPEVRAAMETHSALRAVTVKAKKAAVDAGLSTFVRIVPCSACGDTERYAANGHCVTCSGLRVRRKARAV